MNEVIHRPRLTSTPASFQEIAEPGVSAPLLLSQLANLVQGIDAFMPEHSQGPFHAVGMILKGVREERRLSDGRKLPPVTEHANV